MILMRGETRAVLPVGPWAFKFSRSEYGARCNRLERDLYERSRSKPHRQAMLCPVLWCSRSGWLLIARRAAATVTQDQLDQLKERELGPDGWYYAGPGDDVCPFEFGKPNDWGVLDGRLVAVDYAATCSDD
jgi:hypothetical protein